MSHHRGSNESTMPPTPDVGEGDDEIPWLMIRPGWDESPGKMLLEASSPSSPTSSKPSLASCTVSPKTGEEASHVRLDARVGHHLAAEVPAAGEAEIVGKTEPCSRLRGFLTQSDKTNASDEASVAAPVVEDEDIPELSETVRAEKHQMSLREIAAAASPARAVEETSEMATETSAYGDDLRQVISMLKVLKNSAGELDESLARYESARIAAVAQGTVLEAGIERLQRHLAEEERACQATREAASRREIELKNEIYKLTCRSGTKFYSSNLETVKTCRRLSEMEKKGTISNAGEQPVRGLMLQAGPSVEIKDEIPQTPECNFAHCALQEELELEKGKRQAAEKDLHKERARNSRRQKKLKNEISAFIAGARENVETLKREANYYVVAQKTLDDSQEKLSRWRADYEMGRDESEKTRRRTTLLGFGVFTAGEPLATCTVDDAGKREAGGRIGVFEAATKAAVNGVAATILEEKNDRIGLKVINPNVLCRKRKKLLCQQSMEVEERTTRFLDELPTRGENDTATERENTWNVWSASTADQTSVPQLAQKLVQSERAPRVERTAAVTRSSEIQRLHASEICELQKRLEAREARQQEEEQKHSPLQLSVMEKKERQLKQEGGVKQKSARTRKLAELMNRLLAAETQLQQQ